MTLRYTWLRHASEKLVLYLVLLHRFCMHELKHINMLLCYREITSLLVIVLTAKEEAHAKNEQVAGRFRSGVILSPVAGRSCSGVESPPVAATQNEATPVARQHMWPDMC